jgi:hypothetical protein
MESMNLSKIQHKRDASLKKKYYKLGLSDKEIKYREYQRKYYEIMKARKANLIRNGKFRAGMNLKDDIA